MVGIMVHAIFKPGGFVSLFYQYLSVEYHGRSASTKFTGEVRWKLYSYGQKLPCRKHTKKSQTRTPYTTHHAIDLDNG